MCQILGMNCAQPTSFDFSLKGFCRRGGLTDVHAHGFGLCLYRGHGLQSFHDVLPACKSPIARFLESHNLKTHNMMAHIRYATRGEVRLENVHPFSRVWKGVQMCFCHNGDCPKFACDDPRNIPKIGNTKNFHDGNVVYHPVGDTDSEAMFCAILNALSAEFPDAVGLPTLPVLHEFLSRLCEEIIEHCQRDNDVVIFNFLLGCGPYTLFAYSWPGRRPGSDVWNGLHYIVREPPFARAQLLDVDYSIDFSTVTNPDDRVAVITTKPLTDEPNWIEIKRGELILFDKGKPYNTPQRCEFVEKEGRGLFSKCFPSSIKCNVSPFCKQARKNLLANIMKPLDKDTISTAPGVPQSPRSPFRATRVLPMTAPAMPKDTTTAATPAISSVPQLPLPPIPAVTCAVKKCSIDADQEHDNQESRDPADTDNDFTSLAPQHKLLA